MANRTYTPDKSKSPAKQITFQQARLETLDKADRARHEKTKQPLTIDQIVKLRNQQGR